MTIIRARVGNSIMTQAKSSGTGPIIFSDHTARRQLISEREVVTFRKSKRTTGDTWWRETRLGPKEGDVHVTEIGEIDPSNTAVLVKYQELSGFESVSAWQQAIRNLNGSLPDSGHLYHVTMRE